MKKIKLVDKEFWKYFWLCSKDSGKEWLVHFEGWKKITEPIGIAITTAILTLISQRIFNGELKMSDVNIAIISVIGAPIVWFGLVYLVKLVFAPFSIYKQQEGELEKFNWKNITFQVFPYDMFKDKGWGIKATNNKKLSIHLILELDYLRVGDNLITPTIRRHYLGNVNENEARIREKIVWKSNGETVIEDGKDKIFPLTKVSQEGFSFLTFPESDRDIDFPLVESVVLINVKGGAETAEGLNRLREDKIEVKILSDGTIEPYDKKNPLWKY